MRFKDVRPQPFVFQLRCDRCGVEAQYNVDDGFNNFLQIGFDASWGSDLGDGNHVELDICHACLKQTLGPWLRVSPAAWATSGQTSPSNNFMEGVEQRPDQDQDLL
ncbi:hypothetical protein LXT12_26020 [Pelomonas sp. P7]|uniref:Uncharacterized protein n=1 Tax=Pelomonas caseinilytica TaxID=2906763 RepID=A0ABS8XLW0_9BURK|nr:hypothetical protein [Pelomonas sp. P7]MCE4540695.1 hypothetical protein [Pelomonas sp. P7]